MVSGERPEQAFRRLLLMKQPRFQFYPPGMTQLIQFADWLASQPGRFPVMAANVVPVLEAVANAKASEDCAVARHESENISSKIGS